MVRPRVYESNAIRQAQYRARQDSARRELSARLTRLRSAVRRAAERGDALARALRTDAADVLLDDLIEYFEPKGQGGLSA